MSTRPGAAAHRRPARPSAAGPARALAGLVRGLPDGSASGRWRSGDGRGGRRDRRGGAVGAAQPVDRGRPDWIGSVRSAGWPGSTCGSCCSAWSCSAACLVAGRRGGPAWPLVRRLRLRRGRRADHRARRRRHPARAARHRLAAVRQRRRLRPAAALGRRPARRRGHPGRLPAGDHPPDRLVVGADRRVDRAHAARRCRWRAPRCSARSRYLAWRLLLAPGWALAVTLIAALPLLEPYKPYTTVVLVVLVPVLIALLSALRRVARRELAAGRRDRAGHRGGARRAVRRLLRMVRLVRARACWPPRWPCSRGGHAPARGLALLGAGRGGLVVVAGRAPARAAARRPAPSRTATSTSTPPSTRPTSRCGATTCPATSGRGRRRASWPGSGCSCCCWWSGWAWRWPWAGGGPRWSPWRAAGRGLAAAPLVRLAGLRHRHRAALPADQRGDPLLPAAAVGVRGPVRVALRARRAAVPRRRLVPRSAADGRRAVRRAAARAVRRLLGGRPLPAAQRRLGRACWPTWRRWSASPTGPARTTARAARRASGSCAPGPASNAPELRSGRGPIARCAQPGTSTSPQDDRGDRRAWASAGAVTRAA